MSPNELRNKLILFFLVTVGFIFLCSRAHAEPGTMDITCKDGHIANHVKGDQNSPCRTHGGTTKVIKNPNDDEPIIVPIERDDADEDMHRVATCVDGSEFWGNTKSHKGACKEHGGVTSWDDGTIVKVKRTEYRKVPKAKADTSVRKTIMYAPEHDRVTPVVYVGRTMETGSRDFCMFSAMYNGHEGEVSVPEAGDLPNGCGYYVCKIDLDKGGSISYSVIDCGQTFNGSFEDPPEEPGTEE